MLNWLQFPSYYLLSSRKASLKDKVFPSPSKAPVAKGKTQSPGPEDGAEASPSKVEKSWSFNEKNRGPKHAFRVRGSTSRQNSEGKGTCLTRLIMSVRVQARLDTDGLLRDSSAAFD